jgi:hypothetical protein
MKLPFQTAPVGRELTRWYAQAARRKGGVFASACTDPCKDPVSFKGSKCSMNNSDNPVQCDNDPQNPLCCDGNKYYCDSNNCCCPSGILEAGALPSAFGLMPGHELCVRDQNGKGKVVFCARSTPK